MELFNETTFPTLDKTLGFSDTEKGGDQKFLSLATT